MRQRLQNRLREGATKSGVPVSFLAATSNWADATNLGQLG
jgi:hypothetical protein